MKRVKTKVAKHLKEMGFGLEITLFKLCVFIGSIYNLHVGKFCNCVYTSNLRKEQTMAVGFHKDQSCVKTFSMPLSN